VLPESSKHQEELANNEKDEEPITLAAISDTPDEASRGVTEDGLETVPIPDATSGNDSSARAVSPLTDAGTHAKDTIPEHGATESTDVEAEAAISLQTPSPQETTTGKETESDTSQNAPLETPTTSETLTAQEIPSKEPEIQNTTGLPSTEILSTSRQDSADDVYRNSSELLGLDSHDEESPRRPDTSNELKTSKPLPKNQHVPVLADTWSGRTLPTTHTIEHVAVSQNYILCIDNRRKVYFSDPNTASSTGWEKADFKADRIFVNSACDFISYVEQGKAYVRVNINDTNPVGNASCQILDQVSLLATCSTCTWAVTADNTLRRVETSKLAMLKSDMKGSSSWKIEPSKENLAQIVCYDTVLWGRTHDETLVVYPGRYQRFSGIYSLVFTRNIPTLKAEYDDKYLTIPKKESGDI
jgi:hypothetical protein